MFDSILTYDAVTGSVVNLTVMQFVICIISSLVIGFGISLLYLILFQWTDIDTISYEDLEKRMDSYIKVSLDGLRIPKS